MKRPLWLGVLIAVAGGVIGYFTPVPFMPHWLWVGLLTMIAYVAFNWRWSYIVRGGALVAVVLASLLVGHTASSCLCPLGAVLVMSWAAVAIWSYFVDDMDQAPPRVAR